MVDFRRGITAFAALALFAGLASAQNSPLTCTSNVTVTPALRGEGFTEQTGDIAITCTGGITPQSGSLLPAINITVFYNTTVTSRLLPTPSGAIQSSSNTSEALLLIDEPGSGLATSRADQSLCLTPLTGCSAYAPAVAGAPPTTTSLGATLAQNVYQGVVNGNSVTFFGVPVLPPTTTTASRVFRITNVRVNAQPLAGGSASGASPVQASIVISGATSLPIQNPAPIVGFVSNGLTATASGSTAFTQCGTQTRSAINTITFTENFGTAFKTRVNALTTGSYAGQGNGTAQNVPGSIYNSESNFVFPLNTGQTAGLADFGTRLKATFNNIPTAARIFVSTTNVQNATVTLGSLAPAIPGGSAGNLNNLTSTYTGYAQLVSSESASDGNGSTSFFPAVTATDNATLPAAGVGPVNIAEVALVNGTGAAVWEVVNTNPNTIESFKFGVYITYVSNVAQNAPLPGTSTVNLSFAPTATSGAASSSLPIPRFSGDTAAARNVVAISICRTVLLYPYVTNQGGFDTGLSIANTSLDSFAGTATGAQAGSCKLTWYGGTTAAPTTAPAASDTGNIAAGAVWVNTLQTLAPSFQGYMFAVCNFQYAHGFAFISDLGARNLAMGYLAVVLNDTPSGSRTNTNTTTSENGGH